MLTLRVEWSRAGEDEHSMHECTEYSVQRSGSMLTITMDQGGKEPRELLLDGAAVVYAMNKEGRTIDTIRHKGQGS